MTPLDKLPASLAKFVARHQVQIAAVDDEREVGDGYWLYLDYGWCVDGVHLIHENTVAAVAVFRRVTRCNCPVATVSEKILRRVLREGEAAQRRGAFRTLDEGLAWAAEQYGLS